MCKNGQNDTWKNKGGIFGNLTARAGHDKMIDAL